MVTDFVDTALLSAVGLGTTANITSKLTPIVAKQLAATGVKGAQAAAPIITTLGVTTAG